MKVNFFSILLISILNTQGAKSLVASPGAVDSGNWNLELQSTSERGKVEPNENRSSFQSAEIDVHQLSLSKGISDLSFGSDHFVRLDVKYFNSGEEQVSGRRFYAADTGNAVTLSLGFNFAHELKYASGFYFSISPVVNFNKEKFSVPRIDLWSLGFRTEIELNEIFSIQNNLHYGAGISGKQNSYIALSHLFAARLGAFIDSPISVKSGPYSELDTSERIDSNYDAAFSPPGTQDRIRSMKVGLVSAIEIRLSKQTYGSATYVQKLGGYDAPATNATSILVGFNF